MRYYKLILTNPKTGQVYTPPGFKGLLGGASYTSYVNGQTLPGAWDVTFDLPVIGQGTPQGNATIQIWGISVAEIAQANNLGPTAAGGPGSGYNVQLFGGMQKGLPLAKPQQSRLLLSGSILQAFGNWINTDMTLDLVVMPITSTPTQAGGIGTLKNPKNLELNWQGGQTLQQALTTTLRTGFPSVKKFNINIDPNIVAPTGAYLPGFYPTLTELNQYVGQVSRAHIKTAGYAGVSIWVSANGTINAIDGTQHQSNSKPKQIAFTDLIGQPTWIGDGLIQFKTVMRGDLDIWNEIKMPPALVTDTAASASSLVNLRAAFQGNFNIASMRHLGSFRNPSADAWVTVFDAAPQVQIGTGFVPASAAAGGPG